MYQALKHHRWRLLLMAAVVWLAAGALMSVRPAQAQVQISFGKSGLQGDGINNPTSLEFGPDGRLYVSQVNGDIKAYTIVRNGPNDYQVTNTETITEVKQIPNYNDDGTPNSSNNRQITGLVTAGTGINPVLYVTSSDPRVGAGGGGNDLGLDTNSGIISRLTCTGGIANDTCQGWEKVDIVRGLPRSEENHASNGMQLDEDAGILYLAQGGHTNAGAPSNNFAKTTEYALAAAVLQIDLNAIEQLPIETDTQGQQYIYDIPTLDDPSRTNEPDGSDPNDPFGGNDGLNQAKIVPGGPVQIYSPGWRNLYDIVITESGLMYGIDNGANGGWGGFPEYEESYDCTNNYIADEPGSGGPGPDPATYPNTVTLHDGLNGTVASDGQPDGQVNNKNGLHLITEGYYAGHPAPIRGNPAGAGLYLANNGDDDGTFLAPGDPGLPVDWPPVPVSDANPVECDFQNSGEDDGAIANYGPSTNGITEYTASNFNGALTGTLLAVGFVGSGPIYQIFLNENGTATTNCTSILPSNCNDTIFNSNGQPLDIIAQDDNEPFGGTVWVAGYGADNIEIFEPSDYDGNDPGVCTAADDDTIDEDGDGYTNADELDNGTNPCSAGSTPPDNDNAENEHLAQFKRSDLNDTDDDNDTIPDVDDSFAIDATNGTITNLPVNYEFFNETPGLVTNSFFGLGFSGLMTNGSTDYLDQFIPAGGQDGIVAGGAVGAFTVPQVTNGDAYQTNNSQDNGFQFGINVNANTGPFTIESQINNPFFNNQTPVNFQSQGIFIGTGDQDNYLKLTLTNDGTSPAFQVLTETNGTADSGPKYPQPASILAEDGIRLYLSIDPAAGTVQPKFSTDNGATITDLGSPVTVSGPILSAIQGTYQINGVDSRLAVGVIATSFNNAPQFNATWDFFRIAPDPSDNTALVQVNTNGINGSTFSNSSFNITNNATSENITQVTFNTNTAILPEIVFDPNGTAGDDTAKGFTPNNNTDVDTGASATFTSAHEGGFYGLQIDFTDFNPGETLQFGVDMDPTSITGTSAPGPNDSGSVSGLELTGTTVTVTFANGETHTTALFASDAPTNDSDSQNNTTNLPPDAPTISMTNVPNESTVFQATQEITVSGTPNSNVQLLQLEAGLFLAPNANPTDPFEVNSVVAVNEYTATLNNNGEATFNVTLTRANDDAGYNLFAAVVNDQSSITSDLSNVVRVLFDPDAAPAIVERINAGGPQYTDVDGNVWSADQYFTGGQTFSSSVAIANTDDDTLYQTERWGNGNWTYNIPVTTTGPYYVDLHLAELYFGLPGGGSGGGVDSRVFDIAVEGVTVLDEYDIVAEVGPGAAVIESVGPFTVNDGFLTITGTATTNNAKLSAIAVATVPGGPVETPILLDPIADQINFEGDDVSNAGLFVAATGGDGNLQYSISGVPAGVEVEPTNGQITGTIADGAAASSPYTVTITVDDSDDNPNDTVSTTFEWVVNVPQTGGPGTVLYRVNAGGLQLPALPIPWSTDQASQSNPGSTAGGAAVFGTPSPYINLTGVNNQDKTFGVGNNTVITNGTTAPDQLFRTERWNPLTEPDNMQWNFPVQNGDYTVNLYFAEVFGSTSSVGARVFDVTIEGSIVLDDFDQFADSGANTAILKSFPVTITDGNIDIDLIQGVENPNIKGIEIIVADEPQPNVAPEFASINGETVDGSPITVTATEGTPVSVPVIATDADADPIQFGVDVNPNTATGFNLTPGTNNGETSFDWANPPVGTYIVTLAASDPTNPTTTASFTLVVEANTPTVAVDGTVSLQTRTDNSATLDVQLWQNGVQVYTFAPTSDASGAFSFGGDIVPGEYEIRVKSSNNLADVQLVELVEGTNAVTFDELLAGDANNDNLVDVLDFSILAAAFGTIEGDSDYDERANFNGDTNVDALDFSLLASNFEEIGEEPNGAGN